jgi:hypothetical protein
MLGVVDLVRRARVETDADDGREERVVPNEAEPRGRLTVETSGDALRCAVQSRELRDLAVRGGPVATVYLNTPGAIENASHVSLVGWRSLRRALSDQGADEAALRLVDPLVESAHEHGVCLAAVASAESLWHVEFGPEPPHRDFGCWESLPVLGPLVRWRQSSPPYILVVTDRRGADITVVGRHSAPMGTSVDLDDGRPLHKAAPGGWSQRRYQQRAENTWETHAKQIADHLRRAADEVGAEIIIVTGDVRAVELLEEHLPDRVLRRIKEVSGGGRAADGSSEHLEEEVHRWVMTAVARSTVALLEKFREERGQRERAADGPDATLLALSMSEVDVLLVHDDWQDPRRAWFGPDPIPVSREPALLRDLGVSEPSEGRLVDVAIRAALGTGAGVWMVPRAGGPAEGIGAVLRW